MLGMWVFGVVVMAMIVSVTMVVVMVVMVVTMMMVVMVVMVVHLQPTRTSAKCVAQGAVFHIRSRCRRTLTFNMMMMAFLNGANLGFEPQHFNAVFAHNTGRGRHIRKCGVI
jgi:hypothetical protein